MVREGGGKEWKVQGRMERNGQGEEEEAGKRGGIGGDETEERG